MTLLSPGRMGEKRYPSIEDHREMLSAEEKVDELHD
jgi:hypothetical protein